MAPRRKKIYEGKAKILYEGTEPGTLVQYFKDDATAFNAQKKAVIEGKGVLNNRLSEFFMNGLTNIGVPNHFIRRINMREQLIRQVEIIPIEVTRAVIEKATGEVQHEDVTFNHDECNRPSTTLDGLASLKPVKGEDKFVTAGNASQLSDGAAALVVMDGELAAREGVAPLGAFRGFAIAGCEPDEMGIGPVFAVPKLLARHGLTVDDIDLWELNEAFAAVVLRYMQALDIPHDRINVCGGAIAMGHPLGATGAMILGTVLDELERSDKSTALITLCIGGGMGTATVIERV